MSITITPERTIGSIVADDYRSAAVFNTHGIDFCCKGGRTIAEVCSKQGLDAKVLEKEIMDVLGRDAMGGTDFKTWSLAQLIEHIERVHHRYVEARSATLLQFLDKLCKVHGERHPELFEITREFSACAGAMATHMKKEELVLFPYIAQLEKAAAHGTQVPTPHFGTVNNPVHMMETDHDAEGERFRRISALTDGYVNPPDGCTTYATAMAMLRDFEEDLHLHIHLENNILFPRAIALEKQLTHA